MRLVGYGAVAAIATLIVSLSFLLGGEGTRARDHDGAAAAGAPVGATGPAFSLTDVVSGNTVTAGSLRGRPTLMFFSEGVSCQACLVQAADLQRNGALRRAGIQLVSVTTDRPDDLAIAARQYGITAPMLADPTTEMSAAYGMLGHGGMGHPNTDGHAFILLDENGRVLWHRAYQEMYVETGRLLANLRAETGA